MSVIGYIIVDRETKDIDWDGEMHPSAQEAIASLTGPLHAYCATPADENEDKIHWAKHYMICPVTAEEEA